MKEKRQVRVPRVKLSSGGLEVSIMGFACERLSRIRKKKKENIYKLIDSCVAVEVNQRFLEFIFI